jgi:hypothetical protein
MGAAWLGLTLDINRLIRQRCIVPGNYSAEGSRYAARLRRPRRGFEHAMADDRRREGQGSMRASGTAPASGPNHTRFGGRLSTLFGHSACVAMEIPAIRFGHTLSLPNQFKGASWARHRPGFGKSQVS